MTKAHHDDYRRYDDFEEIKGRNAKPVKKIRKWEEYVPKFVPWVEKEEKEKVVERTFAASSGNGLCPCGCGKEVPNGCFWATSGCGKAAKKKGLYMPQGGELRSAERMAKKIGTLRKGIRHG